MVRVQTRRAEGPLGGKQSADLVHSVVTGQGFTSTTRYSGAGRRLAETDVGRRWRGRHLLALLLPSRSRLSCRARALESGGMGRVTYSNS